MTSHSQTQCLEHQTWLFPHKSATEQNLLAWQVLVYGGAVVTWHPLPQLGLGELRQFSLMLTTSAGGWGGLGSADALLLFCGFLPCSEPQEQENSHVPSNTGFQDASSKCSIGQGKSQTQFPLKVRGDRLCLLWDRDSSSGVEECLESLQEILPPKSQICAVSKKLVLPASLNSFFLTAIYCIPNMCQELFQPLWV